MDKRQNENLTKKPSKTEQKKLALATKLKENLSRRKVAIKEDLNAKKNA
jgi:hypothetical protein